MSKTFETVVDCGCGHTRSLETRGAPYEMWDSVKKCHRDWAQLATEEHGYIKCGCPERMTVTHSWDGETWMRKLWDWCWRGLGPKTYPRVRARTK